MGDKVSNSLQANSANFAWKLSEKGYEHCSNGEFEGVRGAKMRRKALSLVVHRATPWAPPTLFRQLL